MGFKIEQIVKTKANVRPKRFAKKSGEVVSLNRRDKEVGIWLGDVDAENKTATAWFKYDELTAI